MGFDTLEANFLRANPISSSFWGFVYGMIIKRLFLELSPSQQKDLLEELQEIAGPVVS